MVNPLRYYFILFYNHRQHWILHAFGEKYDKDKIGLYRDDGLACFGNINGSQAERIRKEFTLIFKTEIILSITSETNLKIVNVLDVSLNLNTGTHKPYNKPSNNPYILISIQIMHRKYILYINLSKNIQKRLSKLSSTTRIFNNSKDLYNNATSIKN